MKVHQAIALLQKMPPDLELLPTCYDHRTDLDDTISVARATFTNRTDSPIDVILVGCFWGDHVRKWKNEGLAVQDPIYNCRSQRERMFHEEAGKVFESRIHVVPAAARMVPQWTEERWEVRNVGELAELVAK